MTVRTFIFGGVFAALFSWIIWGLILTWLNPSEAPFLGFTLFFLTLFAAVAATTGIIGYGVRQLLTPDQLPAYHVRPALRQGVMLGIFLDILLFLQLNRLLRWWIVVIIIVMFASLELFFLAYDKAATRNSTTEGRRRE